MSFMRSANTIRAKLHLGEMRMPIMLGIVALAILALLLGAFMVLQTNGMLPFPFGEDERIEREDDSKGAVESKEDDGAVSGEEAETQGALVYVHIGGAVQQGGVYELPETARVIDAVNAAGGFSDEAAQDAVNLARLVSDGEQIIVPTEEEVQNAREQAGASSVSLGGSAAVTPDGKVNINTASSEELQTLSGVGPSTAQKIIAEREANGPFASPEDIQRVSGIGEKKYAAIADSICV